jgi:hypothetical protein
MTGSVRPRRLHCSRHSSVVLVQLHDMAIIKCLVPQIATMPWLLQQSYNLVPEWRRLRSMPRNPSTRYQNICDELGGAVLCV